MKNRTDKIVKKKKSFFKVYELIKRFKWHLEVIIDYEENINFSIRVKSKFSDWLIKSQRSSLKVIKLNFGSF
jgi:hypothetical protein